MRWAGLMRIVALVVWVIGMQTVSAESAPMTPIMLSFATPAQVPDPEFDVKGLRLDLLYGRCQNLYGLDAGLVNHTIGKEVGVALGLVNYAETSFTGLQIGAVNIGGKAKVLQIGVYNDAEDMAGLQIGLVNHTRLMRGAQIGLVNVIENSDVAFFPIVNFFF